VGRNNNIHRCTRSKKGGADFRTAFSLEDLQSAFNQALGPNAEGRLLKASLVTTASAATTATAAGALGLGARFIDIQRAAIQFLAIQACDGAIRFRVGAHLDKSKPSRLTGIPIRYDAHALDGTISLEQGANRILGRSEREIPYKNILHFLSF
jgi:hypothetical protein